MLDFFQFFLTPQWGILLGSSIGLFLIAPKVKNAEGFFKGTNQKKIEPSLLVLTSSLIISWIFAKSIFNAASLGQNFGLIGGIAYGAYYFSFFVAGWVLVEMRMKGNFQSIHDFLRTKFGSLAVTIFSLLIGFRLFNEVWSNSSIIGQFFGAVGSLQYIASIIAITGFTLFYALRGGLRSSLFTDMIQMVLFSLFLGVVLILLLPNTNGGISELLFAGEWTMAMGGNLLVVALLQIFSYPFHDPVMTDRAFISDIKTTRKSFFIAGIIGFILITLFSFLGIYSSLQGFENLPAMVQSSSISMIVFINILFITSAASTLDSTFSSSAKLVIVDLFQQKKPSISIGRIVMIIVAIIGSLPLIITSDVIRATTVSGTMAIGLTPIFLFWFLKTPKISFILSVLMGVFWGILLLIKKIPEDIIFTTGKYSDLLAANTWGLLCVFIVYFLPFLFLYMQKNEN